MPQSQAQKLASQLRQHPLTTILGRRKTIIKYDDIFSEFSVEFYEDAVILPDATYHTPDLDDALGTSYQWVSGSTSVGD